MFPSERHSLHRFLAIYLLSTLSLIAAGSAIFYQYASHRIIDHQNETLKLKTAAIRHKLSDLHDTFTPTLPYPAVDGIETALFDIDRNFLAGEFRPDHVAWHRDFWQDGSRLYFRYEIRPFFLGVATVVARMPLDETPLHTLRLKLLAAFVLAILFIAVVARWLGRLFLAPMHRSITLLDRFIKDTTHELNTPVSTILNNVELFRSIHPELENSEELTRIEIASTRLSRMYDDLTFLLLNHRRHRRIESLDFAHVLHERLVYFRTLMQRKGLSVTDEIAASVPMHIDKEDAVKLIDNLLSNALKYTSAGGKISVRLTTVSLTVEDTGRGMRPEQIRRAAERFFRADDSEGGFGLGLNIVKEITDFYGMDIRIDSREGHGTKVSVRWAS